MPGNINALGLIATVVFTIVILCKLGRKPEGIKQVIRNIIFFILIFLIVMILIPDHMCHAGNPVTQWAIPLSCLLCILIFIRHTKIRIIAILISMITAVGLSLYFIDLVHTSNYIGNPEESIRTNKFRMEYNLELVKETLKKVATTNQTVYPSGWLLESDVKQFIPEDETKRLLDNSHFAETYKLWHTYLTGLYGVKENSKMVIWYPGGLLKDCVDKLEYKEK